MVRFVNIVAAKLLRMIELEISAIVRFNCIARTPAPPPLPPHSSAACHFHRNDKQCAPGASAPTVYPPRLREHSLRVKWVLDVRAPSARSSFIHAESAAIRVPIVCDCVPVQRESMNVQYSIRCEGMRCGMNEANNADCQTNPTATNGSATFTSANEWANRSGAQCFLLDKMHCMRCKCVSRACVFGVRLYLVL